jgi:hypothetical protein
VPTSSSTTEGDTEEIATTPASANTDAGYDGLLVLVGALAAVVVLGGSALLGRRGRPA